MKLILACLTLLGSTAFGATTPVTEANVKAVVEQLQKQNGTVGECRDVRLEYSIFNNPIGQQETRLKLHISKDEKNYDLELDITPSWVLVGNFDSVGNGRASFYPDNGRFSAAFVYFDYASGKISNINWYGGNVCY